MAEELATEPPPATPAEPILDLERSVAAAEQELLAGRPLRLEQIVAVVTGGDSGIGRATALRFAREGADIALACHRDEEGAQQTASEIVGMGRRALVLPLDVASEAMVATFFRAVDDGLGVPHILVNCAGIGASGRPVVETPLAEFDAVLKTDLYGPFLCCREFAARRIAAGGAGRIVNVTSVHEAIPSPGNAAYGAAKGGLLTFTRSLALELAPMRINVNAIAPGLIRTPMTAGRIADPEQLARTLPNIPWNRPGEPEEVAELALYLVSDCSDYVTGQSFTIDGGLELNWGQGA